MNEITRLLDIIKKADPKQQKAIATLANRAGKLWIEERVK